MGSPLRDLTTAFKNADSNTEIVGRVSLILIRDLPPYANFVRYGRRAILRSIWAIGVLKDELNPSRGFRVPSRVFQLEQTLQW